MRSPAYRTAAGTPAQGGFVLQRWHVLALFVLGVAGVIALVAGGHAGDVFETLLQVVFIFPTVLAAAMLGIVLTAPLQRAGVFDSSPLPAGFRLAVGTAFGLGVFSLGTLALGSVGLLHHAIPLAVPALGALVGFLPGRDFVKAIDWSPIKAPATRSDFLFLAAAAPVGVMLIAATFPPAWMWAAEGVAFDVREYHLQLPHEYLANNSTHPLHHNVYSFLPANVEMLYLLQMSVASLMEGRLSYLMAIYPSQFLHCFLTGLTAAIVALAPLRLTKAGRILAVVVFLGTPWVVITGSLAYNDSGMMLYGALALALAFGKPSWKTMVGIGMALGLAVGCKLTAGTMFAMPVAVVLVFQRRWTGVVIASVVALAVYAPWAVRAAADTGNPVFPMATNVLGRGHWMEWQAKRWDTAHRAPPEWSSPSARMLGLYRESVGDAYWSYIPWGPTAAHEKQKPDEDAREPRRPGPLWLAAAIGITLACFRGRQSAPLFVIMGLQVICWVTLTHLQARFLLPLLIPLAWVIGIGAAPFAVGRVFLGTLVVGHACLAAMILVPECGMFLGTESRRAAMIGYVPLFPYPQDPQTPPNPAAVEAGTTYLLGDATPLYYGGKVYYATVFDRQPLMDILDAEGPEAARQYLRNLGVNYLGVNQDEMDRYILTYGFKAGQSAVRDREKARQPINEINRQLSSLTATLEPAPVIGTVRTVVYTVIPPKPAKP